MSTPNIQAQTGRPAVRATHLRKVYGVDISKQRARALARTIFAAVYAALPGNLTVSENLRFFGLLYGIASLRHRVEELLRYRHAVRTGLLARSSAESVA